MSGFATTVRFDEAPVERQQLVELARALRYRAPDGERVQHLGSAGFAYARMYVQGDPPTGEQPLCLEGRWWIAAHARLYARAELIRALQGVGSEATADHPDAWLIVLAYRAWGAGCLSRLNGDFSFAIWDARERDLFGASDQFGSRPLFYVRRGEAIHVSNTLCALRDILGCCELDDLFIADFLCFEFSLVPDATAYRDIRRLPPAHFIQVRSGQAITVAPYWNLPTPALNLSLSPADTLRQFRSHLETAVLERLPQGPVSLSLSGGMDSTSIAAIAARAGASGLKAFTRGSKWLVQDPEPPLAAFVARTLKLPHQLEDSDHQLPFENWGERMPFMPEPLNEPYWGGKQVAGQAWAAHSRVEISGAGGDELLYREFACDLIGRVPVRRLTYDLTRHLVRYRRHPPIGLRRMVRRWRGQFPDYGEFARPPEWMNPDLVRGLKLQERMHDFFAKVDVPTDHPTRPMGCRTLNAATSITRGANDPGTTGLPSESRTPFLDLRLVEFMYSIPALYWCSRKAILREAMSGDLPVEILRRRKTGVSATALVDHVRETGSPWWKDFRPAAELGRYTDLASVDRLRRTEKTSASAPATMRRNLLPVVLNYWLHSLQSLAVLK
ncbi:MAG: asparagine synthetase B family protein [Vicinamibacterales bacterium]